MGKLLWKQLSKLDVLMGSCFRICFRLQFYQFCTIYTSSSPDSLLSLCHFSSFWLSRLIKNGSTLTLVRFWIKFKTVIISSLGYANKKYSPYNCMNDHRFLIALIPYLISLFFPSNRQLAATIYNEIIPMLATTAEVDGSGATLRLFANHRQPP